MKYASVIALAAALFIGSVIAAEHSAAQKQGAAVGSGSQQESSEQKQPERSGGKSDQNEPTGGAQIQGHKGSGSMAEPVGSDFIAAQQKDQSRTSELLGRPVATPDGDKIGDIGDLLLNEEGRLVAALVSVGGFLGIGEKQVAVSWDAIRMQTHPESGERIALVDVSKAQLEQAESFQTLEEQKRQQERASAESERKKAQEQTGQGTDLGGGGTSTAPGT